MKSLQAATGKRVSEETRFLFVKIPVRIVYQRLSPIVMYRKYISPYLSIAQKSRRDKSEATKTIATRILPFHQCDRLNLPSILFFSLVPLSAGNRIVNMKKDGERYSGRGWIRWKKFSIVPPRPAALSRELGCVYNGAAAEAA